MTPQQSLHIARRFEGPAWQSGHDSETAVIRHVPVSIVHQQDFAIAPVMRSQLVEAATTGAPICRCAACSAVGVICINRRVQAVGITTLTLHLFVLCHQRIDQFLQWREFFLFNETELLDEVDEVFKACVQMWFGPQLNHLIQMRVVNMCIHTE